MSFTLKLEGAGATPLTLRMRVRKLISTRMELEEVTRKIALLCICNRASEAEALEGYRYKLKQHTIRLEEEILG